MANVESSTSGKPFQTIKINFAKWKDVEEFARFNRLTMITNETKSIWSEERTPRMSKVDNAKFRKLEANALKLWKSDTGSAKALGAALLRVRRVMEYGAFGKWLAAKKIDRNRAYYCMRVVEGVKPKKKPTRAFVSLQAKKTKLAVQVIHAYGQNARIVMVPVKLQNDFGHIATAKNRTMDELLADIIAEYVAANEDQIQIGKAKGDAKVMAAMA
jgi:hypothetical protein